MCTGLKKCMPTKFSGRLSGCAMSSMRRLDVLDAITVVGATWSSSSASTFCLTPKFSTMASITQSTSRSPVVSSCGVMDASTSLARSCLSLPFFTWRASCLAASPMPRSSAGRVMSFMRVGTPRSALVQAMPPPMMPAPRTAALRTGVPVLAWRLNIFLIDWSFRNTCTSALAACVRATWPNTVASSVSAPARSWLAACAIICKAICAAGCWRAVSGATLASAASKIGVRSAAGMLTGSRLRCCCAAQSTSPAMARRSRVSAASRRASGATTSFTTPTASAESALLGWPPPTQSQATAGPARRESRTVPPKPGNKPSLTSGTPTLALLAITRRLLAMASSNPPPRAKPLMAHTLGTGRSSKRLRMALLSNTSAVMASAGC